MTDSLPLAPSPTTGVCPVLATFVQRAGAELHDDGYGTQAVFPGAPGKPLADGFVAPLTDLGLLQATGADAIKFLHTQLTNDVEHLDSTQARWFGYCTAKGRLLSTFLGWREGDGLLLSVARPQAAALRKRLAMYVMRSKVTLSDRSDDCVLLGLGGAAGEPALASLGLAAPAPMAVARAGDLACVGLAAVAIEGNACPRWLLIVPAAALDAVWAALAVTLTPASSEFWRWTEVLSGIPRIVAGTSEQFVPQMINLELVDGVSFKKGCYPGQEIVARSQYLGKLKRRMHAAHIDGAEPAPGSDVNPAAGGEPCGQVVLAAPSPLGGIDLLFECRTEAINAGVRAGDAALALTTLPYALPA